MGEQGKGEAIDFEVRPNHWFHILDVSLTAFDKLRQPLGA